MLVCNEADSTFRFERIGRLLRRCFPVSSPAAIREAEQDSRKMTELPLAIRFDFEEEVQFIEMAGNITNRLVRLAFNGLS